MLALRVARSLRRPPLISPAKLAATSLTSHLVSGRRCFANSQALAKNRKGPRRFTPKPEGEDEVIELSAIEFVGRFVAARHQAIIKASLGIINFDRAPYDTVISVQAVKDALVETGRLLMSTGVDIVEYSPRRLMADPMVSEQVWTVDGIMDSAGMDPRYMLRAIRIFQENPGAKRVHRSTGSGQYFRNSATGEMEELDVITLDTVMKGTRLYRVLQANPELASMVHASGMDLLSHNIDPINPDDTVLKPEFRGSEKYRAMLKAAGLSSLDFMKASEEIQSALNVVYWNPAESNKKDGSNLFKRLFDFPSVDAWFDTARQNASVYSTLEVWFAHYNKALMVLALEATNEVKAGTTFYQETLQDQYMVEHLRKLGKFLNSAGIKDDNTIPSFDDTRKDGPLWNQLQMLHKHMQLKCVCPVGLLASIRQEQKRRKFPCIGNDDWAKIDTDFMSRL